jgi:hypothetical protein
VTGMRVGGRFQNLSPIPYHLAPSAIVAVIRRVVKTPRVPTGAQGIGACIIPPGEGRPGQARRLGSAGGPLAVVQRAGRSAARRFTRLWRGPVRARPACSRNG